MSARDMRYEAIKVDATTWMVRRCSSVSDLLKWNDEALLRDLPADTTEEQAIQAAVEGGSWA